MIVKKFFFRYFNLIFFLISTGLILTLNFYPLLYLNSVPKFGRTYSLIHNNVQDFYFYQSLMNEGANGSFVIYDPYTTEPSKSSIIFSYFTWAGKISRILNLPHAFTYHALRLLASLFFFTAAFYLLFLLKIPFPRLAYFFFLFASPFFNGKTPYMYFWTGMDAVRRASYLPHHMFGGFLLIASIIQLLKFFRLKKLKYLLIATLLAPIMAFVHTPSLIILLIFLPFACLINIIPFLKKFPKNLIALNFYLFFYWIICLLTLLVMLSQTNKGFPWDQYLLWERNLQYPLNRELVGGLGVLFPFALIGVIISLFSKNFFQILIAVWFAIPLILIPLAPRLGMSNIRLIQGIPYLTLAILATSGIDYLLKFFKKIRNLPQIILSILIIVFAVFSTPVIIWSVKDQIREYTPVYGNTYLDNRLVQAFKFININYPPKTRTLATFYAGNYLPAFTNTISFIGHSGYTYNVNKKEPEVNKFFWNIMSSTDALNLIKANNITLIFQGPEEKGLYEKHLYPEILKPVYDREEATIYVLK